jgi:exopolysaccharide biosynthesis polyprenyl glycosylphosphotransferase
MNMASPDSVATNLYAEAVASPRKENRAIPKELFKSVMAFVEAAADFLTCVVGTFAAYLLCGWLQPHVQIYSPIREATATATAAGLLVVLLLYRDGAYQGGSGLLRIRETARSIQFPFQSLLLLMIISFLLGVTLSGIALLVALALVSSLMILQKQLFFSLMRRQRLNEHRTDRVVLYGAGETGKSIVSALFHSPRLGFNPVAVIDDDATSAGCIIGMGYRHNHAVPVQHGPVTPSLLQAYRCNVLMVATPNLSHEKLATATFAAKQAGSGIAFLHGAATLEQGSAESVDVDGLLLTSPLERATMWHFAIAKRLVDLVVSTLLLLALAPLLFLIALLVRLDSPGSSFFTQERVGRNGRLFTIYKFRSMYMDTAKYDFSPTTSRDPRITRIGRFLRRTSLDELPQLINVFLGNMSLVGPRPEMPFIVEQYNVQQRRRLEVAPGLTGLWQLSADRSLPIHENIHYDLYYIRNRNLSMDIAILVHTLFFAVGRGI